MTLIRHATASGGTKIPPGTYRVLLMDLKEDLLENALYGNGNVIRFELEVCQHVDVSGNPIQLDALANDKLTPKSKLWGWLEAFGLHPEVEDDVDMEAAVGQEALAVVENVPGKDGTGEFSRVANIIPLPANIPIRDPVRADGEPDFDAFWKRIRAAGFERKDVAPYADDDLSTVSKKSADELSAILEQMGA